MKNSPVRTIHSLSAVLLICLSLGAATAPTATSQMVKAANAFLATLDQKQRQSVLFAFNDEKQRARWSNLPVSMALTVCRDTSRASAN